MPANDWKKLRTQLSNAGWQIDRTNNGHWKATPPDPTKGIVHFSDSNDPRAFKNTVADLRRSGFQVDEQKEEQQLGRPLIDIIDILVEGGSKMTGIVVDDGSQGADDKLVSVSFEEAQSAIRNMLRGGEVGERDLIGLTRLGLVGLYFKRADRIDPRDPKSILSVDESSGKAVMILQDRHGRKLRQGMRAFYEDFLRRKIVPVHPDEAEVLPSVKGMAFPEALYTLRTASDCTQKSLAGLLGDRGLTGQAVGWWEQGKNAPVRKHYEQLLILWPGLREAQEPDFKLPEANPPTGPRDSEPGQAQASAPIRATSVSAAMRAIRMALRDLDAEVLEQLCPENESLRDLLGSLRHAKAVIDQAVPEQGEKEAQGVIVDDQPVEPDPSSLNMLEAAHDLLRSVGGFSPRFKLEKEDKCEKKLWFVTVDSADATEAEDDVPKVFFVGHGRTIALGVESLMSQAASKLIDEEEEKLRKEEEKIRRRAEEIAAKRARFASFSRPSAE